MHGIISACTHDEHVDDVDFFISVQATFETLYLTNHSSWLIVQCHVSCITK